MEPSESLKPFIISYQLTGNKYPLNTDEGQALMGEISSRCTLQLFQRKSVGRESISHQVLCASQSFVGDRYSNEVLFINDLQHEDIDMALLDAA